MSIVLDSVAPVFALVAIGFAAARAGWFDAAATRGLNQFCFTFALPVLLFRNLAVADLSQVEIGLFAAYYTGALTCFALGYRPAARLFHRTAEERAIFGISASFTNMAMLGIPLILSALGPEAGVPLFLLLSIHGLLLLTLTTFLAEAARVSAAGGANGGGRLGLIVSTLRGVATNPLLIGIVAGLAVNFADLSLPAVADKVAKGLGEAAVPCALFALGATLARLLQPGELKPALLLVSIKLLVQPAIVFVLAQYVFALQPLWTAVATVAAALPTGANAYLMAHRYDRGIRIAALVVVLSTALSAATLSALLVTLPR